MTRFASACKLLDTFRRGRPIFDLIADHFETPEPGKSKGRRDRDVRRIAAGCHQDPANARCVMARIASPPPAAQIHLKPGAEIHRAGDWRNPNVPEIARGIACGDVHGAAQCDRKVLEVAAYALFLDRDIERRFGGTGKLIPERDFGMHPIEDRLHARPSLRRVSEKLPGEARELIDFAVAAREQELNHVRRQPFDGNLRGVHGNRVGIAGVFDQRRVRQPQSALRRQESNASIAKSVGRTLDCNLGKNLHFVRLEKIFHARRMHI